ncbi:MAG: hypothetical protein QNJ97_27645 [Myxococcota bacterium]|nr:hypothetical protein [Myxococcota bacterium]
MNKEKENNNVKRSAGRPLKNVNPVVPWDEVDSLIVHGEAVETENGTATVHPSFREIAKRYGVSHSLISKYSRQHNCMRRRKQLEKRVRELADLKIAEYRAEELAIRKDDMVRAIDKFLLQFEESLTEGRVRVDNPTDYNTMVRLRSFIMGDADSRQEHIDGITLDELARRHEEARNAVKETTPAMRGEVVKLSVVESEKDESAQPQEDAPT